MKIQVLQSLSSYDLNNLKKFEIAKKIIIKFHKYIFLVY